jgi:hypothetical protein
MRAMEGAAELDSGARNAAGAPAAASADKAAAPAYSGTNVHEQGVDEPDLVKTDGRRIVTVQQNVLRVVDAASRKQTGRVQLLGVPDGAGEADLLLAGDRALVLMRTYTGYRDGVADRAIRPYAGSTVFLVDLAGATPRVISRFDAEGELVDARQTGTTARVVLRTSPRITFPHVPDKSDENDRVKANRKLIDDAPAAAWLPRWTVTTGGAAQHGEVDCGQVSRPPVFSGKSLVTVHTFDLTAPALGGGDPVSVVADGRTVYGTPTSLYVANDQRWRFEAWPGRDIRPAEQRTEIYRFDTPAGAKPVYAAAGTVPGWLVNQYALSEWEGRLRVATTTDRSASSAVRVLTQRGDKLTQVGVVDGLGKGEQIYSVRFIGPRGYVVTFRQTDPLYSLDLSDPTKPRVTGELKITGYSAHLQPVGENRLIGIGQEADTRGRTQGTQISLFDVSDPAAPRRLAQHQVGSGYSEAEYDPHAILWWPSTNLLVVPIMQFEATKSSSTAGALALRVTDRALEPVGDLAQPRQPEGYQPNIRRSLVIGDVLWTLSDFGLQATQLSTMETLSFVPND